MGRYLVEFGLPLLALLFGGWWLLKYWWNKYFPKTIKTVKDLKQKTADYDKDINTVDSEKDVDSV